MKLESLRRLNPEDYPGIDENLHPLLETLNQNLESIITALQNNLAFEDNFNAEIRSVTLFDDTPIDVELRSLQGLPVMAFCAPELFDYFKFSWQALRAGVVRVQVSFDSIPTDEQTVTLLFVGSG